MRIEQVRSTHTTIVNAIKFKMYEQIRVDPFNHPTSRFTRHRWAARDMRHGAQGRRVCTGEERGVGLGELVEVVVTQFVAEAPSTSMEICNRIPTPDTCRSFPGRARGGGCTKPASCPPPTLREVRIRDVDLVPQVLGSHHCRGTGRGGAVVAQRGWGGGGATAAWGGG